MTLEFRSSGVTGVQELQNEPWFVMPFPFLGREEFNSRRSEDVLGIVQDTIHFTFLTEKFQSTSWGSEYPAFRVE